MKQRLKSLRNVPRNTWITLGVLCFAVVGTVLLVSSHAATPTASVEAEAGTKTAKACVVSDTGASGNQAVRFGTTACGGSDTSPLAALPKIAWEGGPQYWAQFSKAAAAGWTDPSFFLIGTDPIQFSSDAEVKWDKDHGINTYMGGLSEWSPWSLLKTNNMFYVGARYTSRDDGMMPADFSQLVGYRLDDETDGTHTPDDGYAYLNSLITQYGNRTDGRFMFNNYTQQVVAKDWAPAVNYVNNFTDMVSLDMYWYTIPNASYSNHPAWLDTVGGPANPRSATSYGAMVRGLREQDAKDGKLQPVMVYIEILDGGPGEQYTRQIATGEQKGAVWSSIINGARGILWFNGAMPNGDPCQTGNIIRQAQVNASYCGKDRVESMKQVNNQVKALAPVINTQSYQYSFGSNLETMLKWSGGSAYIFAMCSNGSTPGNRTFTLPSGISSASSVTVVDESRTIPVSGGQFTDDFAAEYTYHIYRVTP